MYSIIVASNLGIKCLVVISNSITSENLITVKEFINNWQIAFISKKKKKTFLKNVGQLNPAIPTNSIDPIQTRTQTDVPALPCLLSWEDSTTVTFSLERDMNSGRSWVCGGGGIISLGTRSLKKRYWPTHCSLFFSTLFSFSFFFFFFFLFLFLFGVLTFFCGISGFYPVFTCNKMFYNKTLYMEMTPETPESEQ